MAPVGDARLPRRATQLSASAPMHVSTRLMASWRRSEDYGVSLEQVDPVWAGTSDGDSLFFECGREVLTALHRTLADEPISMMLTDADGLVLNRFSGDTSLLRALDKVHLAPGFAFSEREAGTNGLGLALADRVPTIVRGDEHYSASLCTYTCAAVPVLDPTTGRLEGSVNFTTWTQSSSELLLALAQSAAGNTAALMVARSHRRAPRPQSRGGIFRVQYARLEPGSGTLRQLSSNWTDAVDLATAAIRRGEAVAAVGEPGSGRATLLAQALRNARPRDRILSAVSPEPDDVPMWLSLWTPELSKPHTAVIVSDVDALPASGATLLHDELVATRHIAREGTGDEPPLWSVTAEEYDEIPASIRAMVDTVVRVPALRDRADDIVGLARYAAHTARGRDIEFTPAAERAVTTCAWPGNIDQLLRVIHDAAMLTNLIDTRHLPAEVLSGSGHRLTRIEAFECAEIRRCLGRPGVTMKAAAAELGMSRATLYRKVSQYGLHDA